MRLLATMAVIALSLGLMVVDLATAGESAGSGWPCWRGPLGGGVAPDPGFTLVEDLGKATLVWTSADQVPYGYETSGGWQGGYSSPIVADGRVFLGYVRPHGREVFDMTAEDIRDLGGKKTQRHSMTVNSPWRIQHGDDVIHSFDAVTGKTLWRYVDERGLMNTCDNDGGHFTPCVSGGKVCMYGSTGRFYCVDAVTGKLVWETYLNDANKDAFELSIPDEEAEKIQTVGQAVAYIDEKMAG
jgi:outer membrane protein assembly factor BamB